jgi:hypothetical protein
MNPRAGQAQKDNSVHEMESAGQIWRFLLDSKNIQPKLYDQDIVFELSKSLNIRGDAAAFVQGQADFAQAIDDHHVSREELIYALFSAAQPFAEMMEQLCSFFERHAVHGTDQARYPDGHQALASSIFGRRRKNSDNICGPRWKRMG